MLHKDESYEFKILSLVFIATWIGIILVPHGVDTHSWNGIERIWLTPFFAPWVAMIVVVYGGTWLARSLKNEAWLLTKSFWPKQIFIWLPVISTLIISQLHK